MERLDKILANAMIGSRKEVVKLIRSGVVSCDDIVISDPAAKWNPNETKITVNGQTISFQQNYHIMLNKPRGYISATEDTREKTVLDLIPDGIFPKHKLFPAGRLDKDTEGFVLLTTDGKLAHRITGPKNHVNKTYFVTLNKPLEQNFPELFLNGITLDDGYLCKSGHLDQIDDYSCYLTIFEGKFHQVKRMFESLGHTVTYLKRVQIGSVRLDASLPLGAFRELTQEEVSALEIVPQEYNSR